MNLTFFSAPKNDPTLRDRAWNVIKYSLLLITPFYQINTCLNVIILLMKQCKLKKQIKQIRNYYNGRYLWFLPNHEELDYMDSVLCLELINALFGPCLTICLNSVLLWYTPTEEIKWSQCLSIGFSLFVITKTFAGAIGFDVEHLRLQRSLL